MADMALPAGKRLGRYEIRSLIGVGGMGEVYLAQDSQLRRSVALKLLPPEFTRDEDRLRRFKQEAFAASGLNHPNIFTIYEIGNEADIYFIATEYIDGIPLRELINKGPVPIPEILDLGVQIASALAAAHAAGIVHRDIKPDNIMVRRDGYVKVLDFGLAKLTEYAGLGSDPEAATVQVVKTDPGKVMGTANYMSPEQTRGLDLDQRTDIWSFGVILYELVTGRVPFAGSTASDVVASILRSEPVALQRYSSDVPAELQRIVRKALRKDPDERYHLAKEMALDLKNLRRDLDLSAELEYSKQPSGAVVSTSGIADSVTAETKPASASSPNVAPISRSNSSAQYVVEELKAHPKLLVSVLAIIGLIAVAVIFATTYFRMSATTSADLAANMKVSRLTTSGTAYKAAISPDGKYVVYAASENGEQGLRIRQVNTNSDLQIVPASDVQYLGLTFSRDGDFIYYVATEKNSSSSNLYVIPSLGGTARKLISDVGSAVTLSPDGQQAAFIRNMPDAGEDAVLIAGTDGANERKIATRKLPNFFRSLSWSPDGNSLVCAAGSFVPTYNSYLVEIPLNDRKEKQLSNQTWLSIGELIWTADGHGLVFTAADQESGSEDSQQLWYVSYPQGSLRRITYDLNNYNGVSITSDYKRLVTVQSQTSGNLWAVNNSDWKAPRQLTVGSGGLDGHDGVAYTIDGQVVYSSKTSGNMDLWIMNVDGSAQRQLTSNSRNNKQPAVSPDGRYIVFVSDRSGTPNIWRMDLDGTNALRLTSGSGEESPGCTPDGKWVLFTLRGAGKPTVWRVSIDGGAPQELIDEYATAPAVSPDGKTIACFYRSERPNAKIQVATFSVNGGQPVQIFDSTISQENLRLPSLRWTADGRALSYVVTAGGVSELFLQHLSGGPAEQLTSLKGDRIFSFDWSRDGKQLIFGRGSVNSDVVLISNFR